MELAEKMDMGHNQRKKRRQSSENVSTVSSVKITDGIALVGLDPPLHADLVSKIQSKLPVSSSSNRFCQGLSSHLLTRGMMCAE